MKKLSFLCFLLSGACVSMSGNGVNSPIPIGVGLYFGKSGGFFPPVLVYVSVGELTVVEIYQPMKGEVLEITNEALLPTGKEEGTIFIGEETAIVRRHSSLYLTQVGKISRWPNFSFKDVPLNRDQTKTSELVECRNRSYLFGDIDKAATAMTKEIMEKGTRVYESERVLWHNVRSEFLILRGKTVAHELATKLPPREFMAEYEKIRQGIIKEIVNK